MFRALLIKGFLATIVCLCPEWGASRANDGKNSPNQMSDKRSQLRRRQLTLRGEIHILQQSIGRYQKLARQCEDQARVCLNAKPPRFSSATAFQSQASQAYSAIRSCKQRISVLEAQIAKLSGEIARLG